MTALFAAAGALSGYWQARSLRRAAQVQQSPFGFWLRLLLVGGVLLVAAMRGHMLAAALGWGLTFVVSAVAILRRWS